MVFVQKWPFLQIFFLGNIGQENVFYDILERKNGFLGYEKKKFQNSKNSHFSHGFCLKMAVFESFFFRLNRPGKWLLRYCRTKNAFLGYKKNRFKKSKSGHFSNFFFFRQYRPGKYLFRYSKTKKRPF